MRSSAQKSYNGKRKSRTRRVKTKWAERGFTDKGFVVLMIFNGIVFLFAGVMIWRTNDLSPLAYAIPAAAAELATYSMAMIRKNQAENQIKLQQKEFDDP